jgi:hypothetical protein
MNTQVSTAERPDTSPWLRSSVKDRVPSPQDKNERPTETPPPNNTSGLGAMEFMMGALTDTLQGLRSDMQDLKTQSGPNSEPPRNVARQAEPSVILPTLSDQRTTQAEPADWWYGVGKGRNGATGVFPSWTEASGLILGTSGAVVKKFRDYDKAAEFVMTCRSSESNEAPSNSEGMKAPEPAWFAVAKGKHGICNIFQSWEEASEIFLGIPGPSFRNSKPGEKH